MCNALPPIFKNDDQKALVEKWGGQRVEDAMIFIELGKDHRGLAVSIPVTKERVESVLEAVYGEFECSAMEIERNHSVGNHGGDG